MEANRIVDQRPLTHLDGSGRADLEAQLGGRDLRQVFRLREEGKDPLDGKREVE